MRPKHQAEISSMCRLLSLAQLHAAFQLEMSKFITALDSNRIKSNFTRVHEEVDGNPVVKKRLRIQ